MADDEEYDEVEAVVRIPKGERLADSRKTEGWSRGFTPKSSGKGPEHVEIQVKDKGAPQPVWEPQVIYVTEYTEAPQPPEPGVAAQAAADILRLVIDELIEPLVARWWNTHVIPAIMATRDDFLLKRQARKAKKVRRAKASTNMVISEQAVQDEVSSQQVAAAADDSKITVTSEQFRQLFMTWLAREDAQQALWRVIADSHIKDGDGAALAWRQEVNELSPQQRTERVKEILSANPSILENLRRHLTDCGPLELGETIYRRERT